MPTGFLGFNHFDCCFYKIKLKLCQIAITPVLLMALVACTASIQGKNGSVHHVIIGFGVVTTPKPETESDAMVLKAQSLGIQFSNAPETRFTLGYSNSSIITVPEATKNIVVEVSQRLLGPITVELNPKPEGGNNEKW